jgi:GT2 family glycosyltransferase
MLLSIIIVSYEVKYFLEQCLFSVNAAVKHWEARFGERSIETIVVDNASSDGTVDYLRQSFPSINFIPNNTNVGFARANNQGLENAGGEYVLFLNPDTILPEESLTTCLFFLESHASVGALGVRMIDGGGNFLVESKRGFPTAWRSFCKLSGLSSVFPSSKIFAGYNLGHLKEGEVMEVEVLAGAFMMVRAAILKQIGGFDERFFMYAEDIDLSKRIKDAGFKNYYLGNCSIVHFKGESTRRDRLYIKRFYKAMSLYIKKHYTGFGSGVSVAVMKAAIGLRSTFALLQITEKPPVRENIESARFLGDVQAIAFVKTKWGVLENEGAKTVVLCQGKEFSFSSLLQTIQKLPKASKPMVYASGSNSVVGSANKDGQGRVQPLIF